MIESVQMTIRAERCEGCKRLMIQKANYGVFPYFFKNNQDAQTKDMNLGIISGLEFGYKPYCTDCISNDKADFHCYGCEDVHGTSKIKEAIGDSAEYLCMECYENKSAKEFDILIKELNVKHQYDYI